MVGKPALATAASVAVKLNEFADVARQVIDFIDTLSPQSKAALELAGWHSGHAFALRADLARVAECADRAGRGAAPASAGR
jgi:hypothetical protein